MHRPSANPGKSEPEAGSRFTVNADRCWMRYWAALGKKSAVMSILEPGFDAALDYLDDGHGPLSFGWRIRAAFNTFSAIIPPWAHDGGDKKMIERLQDPVQRARIRKDLETPSSEWNNEWQQVKGPESFVLSAVQNPKLIPLQGKSIAEIAKLWNKDPIDTAFDILIQDEAFTSVGMFIMDEPDVALALRQPWVSVCNDSQGTGLDGVLGREHPHPRAYGTFPRILRKYVRDEKLLTLEDAIRKFTALPAQRMRFADRGVLKAGMWADVVVFDPETVRDLATFDQPNQLSEGMRFVLVNGVPVIEEGKMANALPGKVLTR